MYTLNTSFIYIVYTWWKVDKYASLLLQLHTLFENSSVFVLEAHKIRYNMMYIR